MKAAEDPLDMKHGKLEFAVLYKPAEDFCEICLGKLNTWRMGSLHLRGRMTFVWKDKTEVRVIATFHDEKLLVLARRTGKCEKMSVNFIVLFSTSLWKNLTCLTNTWAIKVWWGKQENCWKWWYCVYSNVLFWPLSVIMKSLISNQD